MTYNLAQLFNRHEDRYRLFLLSDSDFSDRVKSVKFLTDKIANPSQGSDFEKKFGLIRGIFSETKPKRYFYADKIIKAGKRFLRYDVMMLEDLQYASSEGTNGTQIAGYTAFQIHGGRLFTEKSLHVFACEVNPEYFGQRLGAYMNYDVINHALHSGITKVRMGKGFNKHTERMIDTLVDCRNDLEVSVERLGMGWLKVKSNVK